jgi:RNA polymerase sigma-70 factor (ECF subfamily)
MPGGVGIGDRTVEGRPLEDAELIGFARRGDVAAYETLVRRYREVAFRTAYLIARSAADAEDATQEAFVKAYYALDRFRPDGEFRPWILRIVANEARNRRRSARRRESLVLRLAEDRPSGASAQAPEAAAVSSDEARTLLAALAELPERDRLVISYRYLLELSEAETAAALGVRPGTVKSRLSRALDRLRARVPEALDPRSVAEAADA